MDTSAQTAADLQPEFFSAQITRARRFCLELNPSPPIVLSNMAIFKNFQLGGGRRLQFRWEADNVFNQVNWSTLNTTAQFNPAGEQVNANFGQATAARPARVMQGAIRFTF